MIRLSYAQIESLFKQHINGSSVASLARKVGCHKMVLHRRFKKYFNYGKLGTTSLVPVIREYLESPQISSKDKELIANWYERSFDLIVRDAQVSNRPAYIQKYLESTIAHDNRKLISACLTAKETLYACNSQNEFDSQLLHQRSRLK